MPEEDQLEPVVASSSPSSAEEEDDMPADEYARRHGLSVDTNFDINLLLTFAATTLGASDLLQTLQDGRLCQLNLPTIEPLRESLELSQASQEILNDLMNPADVGKISSMVAARAFFGRERQPKLELPLLRSDHDFDCQELLWNIKKRTSTNMGPRDLPYEPLDVSSDEAPEFPQFARIHHRELERDANKCDRIRVSKGVLSYLSDELQDDWSDEDFQNLLVEQLNSPTSLNRRKVTPPLTPDVEKGQQWVPQPKICQLPILSDPNSLLDDDMEAARLLLVDQDSSSPIGAAPQLSPDKHSPASTLSRPTLQSLKIEPPLIPSDFTASSPLKQMTTVKQAMDNVPLHHFSLDQASSPCVAEELFSDSLLEELQRSVGYIGRSIEQERPDYADAVARVNIPVMDFSIPEAQWRALGDSIQRQIQHLLQRFNDPTAIPEWRTDRALDAKLTWCPFASKLGRIPLDESIHDEADLHNLLGFEAPEDINTSESFIRKRPGLAILRVDDDEDEEEDDAPQKYNSPPRPPSAPRDLQSLIRKRKFELVVDHDENSSSATRTLSPNDLVMSAFDASPKPRLIPAANEGSLLLSGNDVSATSRLLTNYVDFRTSKRQKNATSAFFGSGKAAQQQQIFLPSKMHRKQTHTVARTEKDYEPGVLPVAVKEMPTPVLKSTSGPVKIIAALSLGREMFHWIEKLLPKVEIIERDYDRWNTLTWDRNSVARSPIISFLAAEADVIVSPVTGIVITTLIKVIQRPLPGQRKRSALRERVEKVSSRYERLVVLVSDASQSGESARNLNASECAAFSEFCGFVCGLNSNSQVYYVGGRDETLAKWLVSMVLRYSPEATSTRDSVVEDESTWELMLRRAGMNAYAAQSILAELRCIEAPQGNGESDLKKFVDMTSAERNDRFGQLMGGVEVLERVSRVLDSPWE